MRGISSTGESRPTSVLYGQCIHFFSEQLNTDINRKCFKNMNHRIGTTKSNHIRQNNMTKHHYCKLHNGNDYKNIRFYITEYITHWKLLACLGVHWVDSKIAGRKTKISFSQMSCDRHWDAIHRGRRQHLLSTV